MLSQLQQHAWWIDYDSKAELKLNFESEDKSKQHSRHEPSIEARQVNLLAWTDEDGVWAALIAEDSAEKSIDIMRVRGLENSLAGPKQWSQLHLWQASL